MAAILIEQEVWLNSQLSIARFYGGIRMNGIDYLIVNTDLVDRRYIPLLKKMGRIAFMDMLNSGVNNLDDAKSYYKASKANKNIVEQDLFKDL